MQKQRIFSNFSLRSLITYRLACYKEAMLPWRIRYLTDDKCR